MTPCRQHRESIAAFVLGALPPAEVTQLRAHLATCDACDRYYDEMMALPPLLDLAGGVDGAAVEAPPGLEDRIARRIAAESSGSPRRPRRVRRPLLAGVGGLALGAAATLGVVFALGGFGGTATADAVDLASTPAAQNRTNSRSVHPACCWQSRLRLTRTPPARGLRCHCPADFARRRCQADRTSDRRRNCRGRR